LVEVSESTVTRLNVVAQAARRAVSQASLDKGASVVSTESIVAMFGAIIPLPLAIPPTVYLRPATSSDTAICLANVSVVMIARAAASPSRLSSLSAASSIPDKTLSSGSGRPITPVEHTTTSWASHPMVSATLAATASASRTPAEPVQAFALPALISTARAVPDSTWRFETTTGAATT
jgi:hypothetical protein